MKFENIGSALNLRWSLASGCLFVMALGSVTASAAETLVEQYVDVPMPEGFRVV